LVMLEKRDHALGWMVDCMAADMFKIFIFQDNHCMLVRKHELETVVDFEDISKTNSLEKKVDEFIRRYL